MAVGTLPGGFFFREVLVEMRHVIEFKACTAFVSETLKRGMAVLQTGKRVTVAGLALLVGKVLEIRLPAAMLLMAGSTGQFTGGGLRYRKACGFK